MAFSTSAGVAGGATDKGEPIKRPRPHLKLALSICLAIVIMALPVYSGGGGAVSKIAPEFAKELQQSDPDASYLCWLKISNDAWHEDHSIISARSLLRRARVDPTGFRLDSLDYTIAPTILDSIAKSGCKVRAVSRWLRSVSVEATAAVLLSLTQKPFVKSISRVQTLTFSRPVPEKGILPTDQGQADFAYGGSYLQNEFTKATKLHQAGLTGKGVRIAILDSGFDLSPPAFDSADVVDTWDFINDVAPVDQFDCSTQSDAYRQNYHGTLVAGTIAGYAPGELIGVAPDAELMLAKTEITCDGTEIQVEEDNWIAAAEWAEAGGADILSSSLGYTHFTDAPGYTFADLNGETARITIAADIAVSKNVLVFTAAGNERGSSWGHIIAPADGDLVLAVGAVSKDSILAPFSSPGPTADGRIKPDCVSLGVQVKSAYDGGGYRLVSGTSFSTPLVAGTSALAFQHDPTLTALEMRRNILETSNRASNPDNDYGYGLFDGARAADIIRIDTIPPIKMRIGSSITLHLTTSGRSDSIPHLSAINPPASSELIDSGNGRGSLVITAPQSGSALTEIRLVANVGYFADTTGFQIETYAGGPDFVVFGPNPFQQSIRFVVQAPPGQTVSITVFNASGEKITQIVDQSHASADDSIRVITWDGRNAAGRTVASGVYLAYVSAAEKNARLKLLKTD